MARTAREPSRRRTPQKREVEVNVGTELQGHAVHDLGRLLAALRQNLPVCIDLSDCGRFDVVALLHVLAVVAERRRRDLPTTFRLPRDSEARDFLRKKSFPSTVGYLTGTPFRFLVDDHDVRYFGESTAEPQAVPETDPSAAIIEYLSNKRFFAFRPYGIKSGSDRSTCIETEWDHWRNPLMMRVLEGRTETRSGGYPKDFTRVVVQEMLASLLRNVAEGMVVTGSQISMEGNIRCLTVAAWQGAITPRVNLCSRLYQHAAERSSTQDGVLEIDANVSGTDIESYAWMTDEDRPSGLDRAGSQEGETTKSVAKPVASAVESHGSLDRSLQALYQSVTNVFDGRLECWSGDLFAGIEKGDEKTKYRLALREVHGLALQGNIIAVRIPLGHA
ncbi:STAS domain-containing protein [Actinoplanes sp. CA-051413]|uniref:STAS domain-containing protein n=1 Tax=Actinoplanes sp. CA-051413 TaxID=3239899 RepID=UPI003D9626CC